MTDLPDLRRLAEAATPGPWTSAVEPHRYPECDDADLPAVVRAAGREVAFLAETYGADGRQSNDRDAASHRRAVALLRAHLYLIEG